MSKELPGAIDRWEDDVRRIKSVYSETLGDGLKRAILIEMLPSTLIEGVMARMKQGESYEDTKDMILNYASTRADFRQRDHGGPAPMDVGAVNEDANTTIDDQTWGELNWVNKGEAKG